MVSEEAIMKGVGEVDLLWKNLRSTGIVIVEVRGEKSWGTVKGVSCGCGNVENVIHIHSCPQEYSFHQYHWPSLARMYVFALSKDRQWYWSE